MDYQDIRFALADGVATISLHRPEKLNAFSGRMGEELGHAFRRCDADDDVRAVVLTGSGRAFCSGADLSLGAETFAPQNASQFRASAVDPPAFLVRKPVVAAVNGHAIGLGLTLALQCDLRFVAREGTYGIVQVRRGVMPDAYSHWTLPRIVGLSRAADLLLSGRTFTGDEAFALGIASRVLPAAEVLPAALAWARDVAVNAAPLSVAITKRLLWQSPALGWDDVERFETDLHHHLLGAPDAREGPIAYLQKRAPRWAGSVARDWPAWPRGPGGATPDRGDEKGDEEKERRR